MAVNINIIKVLSSEAARITREMKALETRRRTGALNASIRVTYIPNKGYTVNALNYGAFQDQGTYMSKQATPVSIRVWPHYKPKTKRNGRGITPLHFTDPLKALDSKNMINVIKPLLIKDAVNEIKNQIRKI